MTDKVYHVPPPNDKVLIRTLDDMNQLNEKIEEQFNRLESLLGVITAHENITLCEGVALHHYFSIVEGELLITHTLYEEMIELQRSWLREWRAEIAISSLAQRYPANPTEEPTEERTEEPTEEEPMTVTAPLDNAPSDSS